MSKRRIVLSIITGLAVSSTAVALTLPNGEEVEELTGTPDGAVKCCFVCRIQTALVPLQSAVLPSTNCSNVSPRGIPANSRSVRKPERETKPSSSVIITTRASYTAKATKKLRKAISEKPMFRPKPPMPIYPSTPKEERREEAIPTFSTTITELTNTIPKTTAGKQPVQRRV